MSACDYSRVRCRRPATAQLNVRPDQLMEVVLRDPASKLARFCQAHAEAMAVDYNHRLVRVVTAAHHHGVHPEKLSSCAYCTPDVERKLRLVS